MKSERKCSPSVVSDSLRPHEPMSLPGSSVHEIFPGKNIGVGCRFLLQEIFSDPGIEPESPAL